MPKKTPMRQCAACREKREKKELLRIVRTPEGEVVYDPRGKISGRGVYICRSKECLARAERAKTLSRALECPIPEETMEQLRALTQKEAEDG